MYLTSRFRHAIVAVVLASSIATAVGAGGAAQADDDVPQDPSAATVPATTSPPPPEESSTTSPTPPESTESTEAPTPTDAPTTTSAAITPSTTTPPAVIATTTTTTPPAAIATTTTVAPNNALATVVAFSAASAPLSPVATPWNGTVALTWKAPSSNGGAPVDFYAVQQLVNGQWTTIGWHTGLSHSAGGLSNGTKYSFRIVAHNAAGWSPASTTVSAVPRTVPSAPLSPAATPNNGSVTLTWKPPSSNGGAPVTQYAVQRLVNGQWQNVLYTTTATYPMFVPGLTNGTKYYFRIRAINAAGWSPASTTISAVPLAVPSAPLSPAATPGNGTVTLTWKPPSSNGGAPVTKYAVQRLINGQWQNIGWPTTGTHQVLGLTNGTKYSFRIRAYNGVGWSPVSTTVSAVPRTVPSAPLSAIAAPGNHEVYLDWTAPSNNGGSAVNGYHVQWSTTANGPWAYFGTTYSNTYYTASSAYFDNGTPYYFRIVASNAAGWSAPSAVVSAVPRTKPSSPAPCNAIQSAPGSLWMTVTWNAPLNNGGAPIQEYTVEFFENGHYLFSEYVVPAGSFNYGAWKMPYYFNDFEVRVHARNAAGYSPACVLDSIDILP